MSDDDDPAFMRFEGIGDDAVLSMAAFQMHSFGLVRSIKDGHPGFVSDTYLGAIAADSTTAMLELESAGLWRRCAGGYVILDRGSLERSLDAWEHVREHGEAPDDRGDGLSSG